MQAPGALCIKLKITERERERERERESEREIEIVCDVSRDCIYTKYISCTVVCRIFEYVRAKIYSDFCL